MEPSPSRREGERGAEGGREDGEGQRGKEEGGDEGGGGRGKEEGGGDTRRAGVLKCVVSDERYGTREATELQAFL